VIAGPPCAGKSTLVAELAGPADVVIDLDRIALALAAPGTAHHRYPDHVRFVAVDARLAAINRAATMPAVPRLWIIHAHPETRHRPPLPPMARHLPRDRPRRIDRHRPMPSRHAPPAS
jgi:hypothetical protein